MRPDRLEIEHFIALVACTLCEITVKSMPANEGLCVCVDVSVAGRKLNKMKRCNHNGPKVFCVSVVRMP